MSMKRAFRKKGFVLVEALVTAAILSFVLAGTIGGFLLSLQRSFENGAAVQATFLAEEGIEALHVMRDNGWDANIAPLASGSTIYLEFDGTTWQATTTNSYIDGIFERVITITEVRRDSAHDIVESGGTVDPGTKKIVSSVSWLAGRGTTTKELSAYLTNIFSN